MEYRFKRTITKPCGWCRKEFSTGRDNEIYCSEACKKEKRKENYRNFRKRMKLLQEQEPVKEKKMSELAIKNAKARALGMSYGLYDVAVRFGRVANG